MRRTTGDLVRVRIVAAELRDEFDRATSELDEHAKNANIVQMIGDAVFVLGGVVALVGFAAIPFFTAGTSFLLVIVGGGIVGSVGELTAGGAKITKFIIEKNKLKQAALKWADFCIILLEELTQESAMGSTAARLPAATAEAFVALSVVLVGLSLYGIRGSNAGDTLRKMARLLDEFARTGQWLRWGGGGGRI